MLLSRCPSCQHQFWLPRVQPRRSGWPLLRVNAYFCPSCGVQLRLQRWVVLARSVAIFIAFVCLIMVRSLPEQADILRILALLFPVFVILFPKQYDQVGPRP